MRSSSSGPIEEVFDFVADETIEPLYNANMRLSEKITDGPMGAGTRFRTEMISRCKPVDMLVEFTSYDRPRRLTSVATLSSMEIRGSLTFGPVPRGTLMRWSWKVVPRGFIKLIAPIAARIGRRQEKAIWTGLKRLLENRARDLTSA